MKKLIIIVIALVLALVLVAGNSFLNKDKTGDSRSLMTLKVGATPVPHGELLELIKEDLLEKNIKLEIVEFTDYVTPNIALSDGDLDANFFQHLPYLNSFAKEHQLALSSIGTIHVEPLGLYSNKIKSIDDLKDKALIAIPSDAVNGGRALILLEQYGLIKLKEGAGLEATEKDIVENKKNIIFKAVEAAQLPRILDDVEASIINGNYALEAGLSPKEDALLLEGAKSPYANIITVRTADISNESLKILVKTLQSTKVKNYIDANYGGGVVEAFGLPEENK